MFEKWIAGQLMHLLGEYLEPSSFSTETLSVGVWSGKILMMNPFLHSCFIKSFHLPYSDTSVFPNEHNTHIHIYRLCGPR